MVAFALGTDTGGSGRVPASYNGIYGLKPAPGSWSRAGLVYACRSFDTATVFAAALEDTLLVDDIVKGPDPLDAFSTAFGSLTAHSPRAAMARPEDIETFGDAHVAALYTQAFNDLSAKLDISEADLAPYQSINDLMFFGPYLAERDVSVGAFIDANPNACHPVVGPMINGSRKFNAADVYRALHRTTEARKATEPFWGTYDVLITPTVGALITLKMCEEDPLGPNFQNGTYTNFASPLGLSALAVPFGRTPENVPWGLTLYTPPERVDAAVYLAKQIASITSTT